MGFFRSLRSLRRDHRAAVAPTVALALTALIGAGGLAFDYAHMAALDTELQDAADQAALAAATQLDGQSGAVARATAAGQALLANSTLFANDGNASGSAVTIPIVMFYTTKSDAENNANGFTDTTRFAEAHFVRVAVQARRANFALTPIVGVVTSGDLNAEAVAGLGSAICKTPPLMLCNPSEPSSNSNVDYPFDANALKGVGIRLVGDGSYAPGNFGFLNTGYGNGANALLQAIGYNTPPGDCVATTGVDTKTGVDAAVMDGFNTRFDVNANGNSCPGGDVNCSPSINVRKDLVRGNQCGITGNGWVENPATSADFDTRRYKPTTAAVYASAKTPDIMGHPRDLCHAISNAGSCVGGRIGTGDWDINAYWRSNYGANYAGQVSAATYGSQPKGYPTRYQVYQWEIDDYANRLNSKAGASSKTAYSRPVIGTCLATTTAPYGLVPGGTTIDRRRISSAVVNCKALNVKGSETNLPVLKWIDVFLVEPSIARTKCDGGSAACNTKYSDKTDLYVEMIGETSSGAAGNTAGQVIKRDVPYLIK